MTGTNHKSYRSGAWRRHILSVVVWAGAVAAVAVLFQYRVQRFEVLGLAHSQVRQIAATCTGRLKSVHIRLFEKVSQGQTLAVLDDEHLKAKLATASAQVQQLMSELLFTQDQLLTEATNRQTDWIVTHRRFSLDVAGARLSILELKTLLETDRITLEDFALEVKIAQQLLKEQAVSPYELQKAEVQYNTLAKKIEENQHLLAQSEQNLSQAQHRRDEFAQHQPQHPSVDNALELIRKSIKVQEQQIAELLVERKALVLKSPFDGMVSQIQRRLGEAVLPGEPILTIAEIKPTEIIVYAGEHQLDRIREGMTVELIKTIQPAQIARSQITYVGPVVEEMPARLWQNPNVAQWGRPFLVKVPPQMELVPGEKVGVRGLQIKY